MLSGDSCLGRKLDWRCTQIPQARRPPLYRSLRRFFRAIGHGEFADGFGPGEFTHWRPAARASSANEVPDRKQEYHKHCEKNRDFHQKPPSFLEEIRLGFRRPSLGFLLEPGRRHLPKRTPADPATVAFVTSDFVIDRKARPARGHPNVLAATSCAFQTRHSQLSRSTSRAQLALDSSHNTQKLPAGALLYT